jgi:hypothetical protein
MANLIQALRITHIERAQQHRIDYSKNDDIHADAQHEAQQRYNSKGWRLPKYAQRITSVQQQILHKWQALSGMVLLRLQASQKGGGSMNSVQRLFDSYRASAGLRAAV